MSTDRDIDRIVRSWMDEGVTQLPDRVLDLVLDQVPSTPQRRPWWPARRFQTLNTYARFGLVAAALVLAAAVGIGIYGNSVGHGPESTPTPNPTPIPDRMIGTWVAPEVTCEQQLATVEAAGYSADQVTLSGWTCPSGTTNHYSFRIGAGEPHILFILDRGVVAFPGVYRFIDSSTFELTSESGDYCITYGYVVGGDQVTVQMKEPGCPIQGEAPLNDQIAQTAVFETAPFTRQP